MYVDTFDVITPFSLGVSCFHAESIVAWLQIGIGSGGTFCGTVPLFIKSFQCITQIIFFRGGVTKSCKAEGKRVSIILQVYCPGISHALTEGGSFGASIGALVEKQEIGDGYRGKISVFGEGLGFEGNEAIDTSEIDGTVFALNS